MKNSIQIVNALATPLLKETDQRMILNIEDCPDHANGPVLDALFELAAQRPQLLVDRGEIRTSLVVI